MVTPRLSTPGVSSWPAEIGRLFARHRGTYGAPRIVADLREAGWRVNRKTVAEDHARAWPGRPGEAAPSADDPTGPGAVAGTVPGRAQVRANRLNHKWYGDGTEIATGEGKLYLDSVLDMGSRRILGFALGEHHDAELAYDALAMAVAVRGGKDAVAGVIMHTDQGSEFTAKSFRAVCRRLDIRQSMGRVGSALDNAVIESWHSTLQFELRSLEHFNTKAQACARIAAWIDEYNRDRRHSGCNMRSPIDHEIGLRTQGPDDRSAA